MAKDAGKESGEQKLTRLEKPPALKIATTCFARILAFTLQEFPRNYFLQSVTPEEAPEIINSVIFHKLNVIDTPPNTPNNLCGVNKRNL